MHPAYLCYNSRHSCQNQDLQDVGMDRILNTFIETQRAAIAEGVHLLETYFTNQSGLLDDLRGLSGSLNSSYNTGHVENMNDKPKAILKIAASLRAAAETLDDEAAQRAQSVLARAEQAIASDIRARIAPKLNGIYVIVDPEATRGRPVNEVARQSLEGGATVVQLRDKLNDKGDILKTAQELKALCDKYDALFVMNDHADLARASDAHVLHVGQTDLPIRSARDILAPRQLIGNSNNGLPEASVSAGESVDYLAVGAIYATTTMGKSGRSALGPEEITRVKDAVPQPIVAIGGINRTNIADVVKAGADSVCVVSAVTFADDPEWATRELVQLYEDASS